MSPKIAGLGLSLYRPMLKFSGPWPRHHFETDGLGLKNLQLKLLFNIF